MQKGAFFAPYLTFFTTFQFVRMLYAGSLFISQIC